jgi:release factor glutamine methyltransferase
MPKLEALLVEAKAALIRADVPSPALDARLLLQHALDITHSEIIATLDRQLTDDQTFAFNALLVRRLAGEPVSRILGIREFYGREFKTSPDVLDPRPDTETLIDLCLDYLPPEQHMAILDLGTGSGILALTLLAERPHKRAVAVDVSEAALAVARENAAMWNLMDRASFVQGNWFENVKGKFDLIVSNPPYIPANQIPTLEIEVRDHDPHLALDGGDDGLHAYRAIAGGASAHLATHGMVAVEIGAGQARDIEAIFQADEFTLTAQKSDLGGHVRALLFSRSDIGKPVAK